MMADNLTTALKQQIIDLLAKHTYNPRMDMSWEEGDEGLDEAVSDFAALIAQATKQAELRGRRAILLVIEIGCLECRNETKAV